MISLVNVTGVSCAALFIWNALVNTFVMTTQTILTHLSISSTQPLLNNEAVISEFNCN